MKSLRILSLFLSLIAATASHAEVKLSKVFTPHMVLQRGIAVPVWGRRLLSSVTQRSPTPSV